MEISEEHTGEHVKWPHGLMLPMTTFLLLLLLSSFFLLSVDFIFTTKGGVCVLTWQRLKNWSHSGRSGWWRTRKRKCRRELPNQICLNISFHPEPLNSDSPPEYTSCKAATYRIILNLSRIDLLILSNRKQNIFTICDMNLKLILLVKGVYQ